MKTALRRHKLLLLSLLLGFCAFVSSYSVLHGYVRSAKVLVALHDVEPYVKLTTRDVRVVDVPKKSVPRESISTLEGAVGSYTRSRLVEGQIVQAAHMIADSVYAGLSHDLPSDARGIFLPLPAERALGGLLREGERVDVIVAYKDIGGNYGEPSPPAFTALRDVPVVRIVKDEILDDFGGVVVLASPADCERIAGHLEDAILYLTLVPRSAALSKAEPEVWPGQ